MEEKTLPIRPIRVNCKTCGGKKVLELPEDAPMNHHAFKKEIPCEDCKGKGYYEVKKL